MYAHMCRRWFNRDEMAARTATLEASASAESQRVQRLLMQLKEMESLLALQGGDLSPGSRTVGEARSSDTSVAVQRLQTTMASTEGELALAVNTLQRREQDAAEAMQVSVGTFAVVLLHVPFRYVDHSCCRAGGAARDRACLAIAELSVGQLCSDFSR